MVTCRTRVGAAGALGRANLQEAVWQPLLDAEEHPRRIRLHCPPDTAAIPRRIRSSAMGAIPRRILVARCLRYVGT